MIHNEAEYDRFIICVIAFLIVLIIALQFVVNKAQTSSKETKRRIQHSLTGLGLLICSYYLERYSYIVSVVILMTMALILFVLQKFYVKMFQRHFGSLLRRDEFQGKQLSGAFYFLLGIATTIGFVCRNDHWYITRYALVCLSFADPMASAAGTYFRSSSRFSFHVYERHCSFVGCVACFVTAYLLGQIFLLGHNLNDEGEDESRNLNTQHQQTRILIAAFICTIAEALPIGNDNLNIPVLTALSVKYFLVAGSTR